MTDKSNPKDVMGSQKDLIHLVPPEAIRGISKAMKYGAREAKRADGTLGYGDYNWRFTKVRLTVYLDAIMRHTMALIDGQDLDPDSGLAHEYHIGANIAIIADAKKYNCLIDDRPKSNLSEEYFKTFTEDETKKELENYLNKPSDGFSIPIKGNPI